MFRETVDAFEGTLAGFLTGLRAFEPPERRDFFMF